MPFSKSSEAYPLSLREVVEAVIGLNQAHSIACASPREAARLRAQFHAFRVACRRDAAAPPTNWRAERIAAHRALTASFEALTFRVEGSTLLIELRDEQDLISRLRPLGGSAAPSPDAASASLDALLQKLEEHK